ncbi:hypothetical protein L6R50_20830 [Myxococcota bacterium]|nr:hypothetical protein [Myxococcota bacterium]
MSEFAPTHDSLDLANAPREEMLETALVLHLPAVAGRELTFLMRARQLQKQADVLAVDPDGRLHLFELKKDIARRDAARQLVRYVTERRERTLDFVRRLRDGRGSFDAAMREWETTASYLLAFEAGSRSVTRSGAERSLVAADRSDIEQRARELSSALEGARGEAPQVDETKAPVGWLVAPRVTRYARDFLKANATGTGGLHALELALHRQANGWLLCASPPEACLPCCPGSSAN